MSTPRPDEQLAVARGLYALAKTWGVIWPQSGSTVMPPDDATERAGRLAGDSESGGGVMRFLVRRASADWYAYDPPCDAAQMESSADEDAAEPAVWSIEMPDLAALVALAEAEGDIIIRTATGEKPCLIIYDDYME